MALGSGYSWVDITRLGYNISDMVNYMIVWSGVRILMTSGGRTIGCTRTIWNWLLSGMKAYFASWRNIWKR